MMASPANKKQKIECEDANENVYPLWRTDHPLVGRYFYDIVEEDLCLFRQIGGYLSKDDKVISGPGKGGDIFVDKNDKACDMYLVSPISGFKNKDRGGICEQYMVEEHELPGAKDIDRFWVGEDFLSTDRQPIKLSPSIKVKFYEFDDDKTAIIYQQNYLTSNTEITQFEDVIALHNQKWIDLRYIPNSGVYEFICNEEWELLKTIFQIFSEFEQTVVRKCSTEIFSQPSSMLECSLLPKELHDKRFIMLDISAVNSRIAALRHTVDLFNTVLTNAFDNDIGMTPLYGNPRVRLLGFHEPTSTSDIIGNIIGFIVITLPESVNDIGKLQLVEKSGDDIHKSSYQPIVVEWLYVQGRYRQKGIAKFLQQMVGALGRHYGLPFPYIVLTVDKSNAVAKNVYDRLGYHELKGKQHLNIERLRGEFTLMVRRGFIGFDKSSSLPSLPLSTNNNESHSGCNNGQGDIVHSVSMESTENDQNINTNTNNNIENNDNTNHADNTAKNVQVDATLQQPHDNTNETDIENSIQTSSRLDLSTSTSKFKSGNNQHHIMAFTVIAGCVKIKVGLNGTIERSMMLRVGDSPIIIHPKRSWEVTMKGTLGFAAVSVISTDTRLFHRYQNEVSEVSST